MRETNEGLTAIGVDEILTKGSSRGMEARLLLTKDWLEKGCGGSD